MAAYNLRFIMDGDMASTWGPFGGISTQLTQLGPALNLAIIGKVTIAMTYGEKVRARALGLSKFRTRENETIGLLKEDAQAHKTRIRPRMRCENNLRTAQRGNEA